MCRKNRGILTGSRLGSCGSRRSFFSIRRRIVTIITRFAIIGSTRGQALEMAGIAIVAIILDGKTMNRKLSHSCRNAS